MCAGGRLSTDRLNRLKGLVSGWLDKAVFAEADLVIEAVFEEMSVEQQMFAEVEAVVLPECMLATHTSALSVTEMAAKLEHPERVVGLHFFNPVAVLRCSRWCAPSGPTTPRWPPPSPSASR
jgi:3-hydroxyacyl-CoA dehydrogenase